MKETLVGGMQMGRGLRASGRRCAGAVRAGAAARGSPRATSTPGRASSPATYQPTLTIK